MCSFSTSTVHMDTLAKSFVERPMRSLRRRYTTILYARKNAGPIIGLVTSGMMNFQTPSGVVVTKWRSRFGIVVRMVFSGYIGFDLLYFLAQRVNCLPVDRCSLHVPPKSKVCSEPPLLCPLTETFWLSRCQ